MTKCFVCAGNALSLQIVLKAHASFLKINIQVYSSLFMVTNDFLLSTKQKLSLSACNLDDKIEFDIWSKGPLLGISNL